MNIHFLETEQAQDLAFRACRAVGASVETSHSLARATVAAELSGHSTVGFSHLLDYLDSFKQGRINCDPKPLRTKPFPAFLVSDADRGVAQLGFDLAFDDITEIARMFGIAVFTQRNSYPVGELGYYVRRLASLNLVSLAVANGDAWMAATAGSPRVYGTNPMAFACPLGNGRLPLVIDQASSAAAYVNIAEAAKSGSAIPLGWALDQNGVETENSASALAGALLPFGGAKGANIALMVELLSAGMSGGIWSLDAPRFNAGSHSPGIGMTLIAIRPGAQGEADVERYGVQVERLSTAGVYIPGASASRNDIRLSNDVYGKIEAILAGS